MRAPALLGHQSFHGHQVLAEPVREQGLGPLLPAVEPVSLAFQLLDVGVSESSLQAHQPVDPRRGQKSRPTRMAITQPTAVSRVRLNT